MNQEKQKNNFSKRKTIKYTILIIIPIIIIFILYINGFIPIGLSAKAPIGTIEEIEVEQYIEKNPELSDLPDYDKILYKIFGTDEEIADVLDSYKEILQNITIDTLVTNDTNVTILTNDNEKKGNNCKNCNNFIKKEHVKREISPEELDFSELDYLFEGGSKDG